MNLIPFLLRISAQRCWMGAEVNAIVVGVNMNEFKVKLSIRRNEEQEDRKRFQSYFKEGPRFTLGQMLHDED